MAIDIEKRLQENPSELVLVGYTDIEGIIRAKYICAEKVLKSLSTNLGFSSAIISWDCADELYDNVSEGEADKGWPDIEARLVSDTLREIPLGFGQPSLFLCCEFVGEKSEYCSRTVLRRQCENAAEIGYEAVAGYEYEFQLFHDQSDTDDGPDTFSGTPVHRGPACYSPIRLAESREFFADLIRDCSLSGIEIGMIHTELGPGMMEVALKHCRGLESADRAVLFKMLVKNVAREHNQVASFMAKTSHDIAGCGGHLHVSLLDAAGQSAFKTSNPDEKLSDAQRWFVGGCQQLLPDLMPIYAPNLNSYKRYRPDSWAPISASWGFENRTSALRVIGGHTNAARLENRIPGADVNPYLSLAATLGSGLYGIRNKIEPSEPALWNAYHKLDSDSNRRLPKTLHEAVDLFRDSSAVREVFGDKFVDYFAKTRLWEIEQFNAYVTDYEIQRYIEAI